MKKSTIFLTIAAAILVVLIGKAFIFNDAVKFYLLIFVAVGLGLALLRLGVNGAIKKMRGKHIGFKILFFIILLGFGLPFQNWFRKDVIFAMDGSFIVPCIITTVASVIFFTIIYGHVYEKVRVRFYITLTFQCFSLS